MLRRAVTLPVPTETVWRAITSPDEIGRWFGARVEWDLRPGGRATFGDGSGGDREGVVEDVEPGRLLRFRWWPASGASGPAERPEVSEVAYELEPGPDGTVLTVTERRVDPVATPAGEGPSASVRRPGGPPSAVGSAVVASPRLASVTLLPTVAGGDLTWSGSDDAALALWGIGPGATSPGGRSDRPLVVCRAC